MQRFRLKGLLKMSLLVCLILATVCGCANRRPDPVPGVSVSASIAEPTMAPAPTGTPTPAPTTNPTDTPTGSPTENPTAAPSVSQQPTAAPTEIPTAEPSDRPTAAPTENPTISPTATPNPYEEFNGKWIWASENTKNQWVRLRGTVTLNGYCRQATAKIAVDSRYWLYVNGELVVFEGGLKRGPTPDEGYYDEVDLTEYLLPGENTIAVLAWFWGKRGDSYSNVTTGKGAFYFDLVADGKTVLTSDARWKVKEAAAYLDDSVKSEVDFDSPQANYRIPAYNVWYDAMKETDFSWEQPGFDDSRWEAATVLGVYGDAPWNALQKRPVPPTKFSGITAYRNSEILAQDDPTKDRVLLMKIGTNIQFTPYLKVKSDTEGKKIFVTTENTDSMEAVRFTYVADASGEQEFESFGWMNGQYVMYAVPAGVEVVDVGYRASGYNTEKAGDFVSDNADFARLWQMCYDTLYVTMRDNFMDCPDRERAQWWGDATSEMEQILYSMDENSYLLYEKGLQQMFGWIITGTGTDRDDALSTVNPISNAYFELPMQQLAGLVGIWNYYLYTGRTYVLEEAFEPSVRYLEKWKLEDGGLVVHRSGSWDWMDWGSRSDTAVIENAWYYYAMSAVEKMAQTLGKEDRVPWIAERKSRLYAAFNAILWTEDGYRSAIQTAPDDRGNALAVLAGLASEDKYPTILQVLQNTFNASPYMEKYVLEAMFVAGYPAEAQDRMLNRYRQMMTYEYVTGEAYTTLWELWDRTGGTMNHAWSGGPMVVLSKYALGVRPTAPAYERFEIVPAFGRMNSIGASVPTAKGTIDLLLYRDLSQKIVRMSFNVPAGSTVKVGVPRFAFTAANIRINDALVYSGNDALAESGYTYLYSDENYYYFELSAGDYDIESAPVTSGKQEYDLSLTLAEGLNLTVDGEQVSGETFRKTVASGAEVNLSVSAKTGYRYTGYNGTFGGAENQLSFAMTADVSLTFAAEKIQTESKYVTLRLLAENGVAGEVSLNGTLVSFPCIKVLEKGTEVTLSVSADVGGVVRFVSWTGGLYGTDRTVAITLNEDVTVNALFIRQQLQQVSEGAEASSDNEIGGWNARNLFDGDLSSGYSTGILRADENGNLTDPVSVTVDFGKKTQFDAFALYPRTDTLTKEGQTPNFPMAFSIAISDDGREFVTVGEYTLRSNPMGATQYFTVAAQNARYVRLKVAAVSDYAADEQAEDPYRVQLMEAAFYSGASAEQGALNVEMDPELGAVRVNGIIYRGDHRINVSTGEFLVIEALPDDGCRFDRFYIDGEESEDCVLFLTAGRDTVVRASLSEGNAMVNYALSSLATVAASDSLTYGSFHLSQLIDGRILASSETGLGFTTASTEDKPMDITISLGALRTVSEVWLYPRQDVLSQAGGVANFPVNFDVECSTDGTNFTVVKSVRGATVEGTINAFPPYKVAFDAPVKTKHVRISVLKRGVSASDESAIRVQLTEIEIYGNETDPNVPKSFTLTANAEKHVSVGQTFHINVGCEGMVENLGLTFYAFTKEGKPSDAVSVRYKKGVAEVTVKSKGTFRIVAAPSAIGVAAKSLWFSTEGEPDETERVVGVGENTFVEPEVVVPVDAAIGQVKEQQTVQPGFSNIDLLGVDGRQTSKKGWTSTNYMTIPENVRAYAWYLPEAPDIYLISFYDGEKNFISGVSGKNAIDGNCGWAAHVPQDAVYVRFACEKTFKRRAVVASTLAYTLFEDETAGETLSLTFDQTSVVSTGAEAGRTDGSAVTYEGWYSTRKIALPEGCKAVRYRVAAHNYLYAVAFFDQSGTFIKGITCNDQPASYTVVSGTVNRPENAAFVSFTTMNHALGSYTDAEAEFLTEPVSETKKLKIACIGDSLTEGDFGGFAGHEDVKPWNYPYYLSRYLDVETVNYGKCGITASGMLGKYNSGWVDISDADIIIVMLGTNLGLTGGNAEAYRTLVSKILQDKKPEAKLVLNLPPHPTENPGKINCGYIGNVLSAVEYVPVVAKEFGLDMIDVYGSSLLGADNEDVMQPVDGLHFAKLGYTQLAVCIGDRLVELYPELFKD